MLFGGVGRGRGGGCHENFLKNMCEIENNFKILFDVVAAIYKSTYSTVSKLYGYFFTIPA